MSRSFIIAILFYTHCSFGQTYEEKVASAACECISKESQYEELDELLKSCVISAKIEIEDQFPDEISSDMFTVEGVRQAIYDISKLVVSSCPNIATKLSQQKKDLHYTLSDNGKANEHYHKGNQYRVNKQYNLAIEQYKRAIKKDDLFVLAYDQLGLTYRQSGDLDKAISTYKQSLRIFPEGDFSLTNLAALYSLIEKEQLALKYYTELIKYYPESPEGFYGSGKSNLILENNELALRNTLIAIILYQDQEHDPQSLIDAKKLLDFVYSKMSEVDQLDQFNKIIEEYNFSYKI